MNIRFGMYILIIVLLFVATITNIMTSHFEMAFIEGTVLFLLVEVL